VAHDPEVERAGDVLGVLEPVLELGVTVDVSRISNAAEKVELA